MGEIIFQIISLILIAIGSGLLAKASFLSEKDALNIGLSRIEPNTEEEQLKTPRVRFLLNQSKYGKIGLAIVIAGIIIQIYSLLY